ncbi:MAG: hypothetical protein ACKOEE_15870 [Tagaea sp.]
MPERWRRRFEDGKKEDIDIAVGYRMLVITYLNHRGMLAAETLYFDTDGMVYMAAACHRPAS